MTAAPTSLPILTAEDVAEILTNARRVHTRPVCLRKEYFKKRKVQVRRLQPLLASRHAKAPTLSPVHDLSTKIPPTVFDDDPRLAVHVDEGQCCCHDCVKLRNGCKCPECKRLPQPQPAQNFREQMSGFRTAESNFLDDIAFIWNRIGDEKFAESLGIKLDGLSEDKLPNLTTTITLSSVHSAHTTRPLEKAATTKDPDHWFSFYWRNLNKTPLTVDPPMGECFHEQLSTELEKVEFNHDLPSGGIRPYSFDANHQPASVLTLHSTDPRFDGLPWAIDGETVTFAKESDPLIPNTWVPPQDRFHTKWTDSDGKKYIFTNARCKVCGALDEQKYAVFNPLGSRKTKVCHVDEKYLCDRESCIRSRQFKQNFDVRSLLAGYTSHRHYAPRIDLDLWSWVRSHERNTNDPNLKCELRYHLDRRGRKGILSKPKDSEMGDAAQPSRVHTDETIRDGQIIKNSFIRRAEEFFHATYKLTEPTQLHKDVYKYVREPIQFDKKIHKIVGASFEESRHIPNYNCFGPVVRSVDPAPESVVEAVAAFDSFEVRDFGISRTSIWIGDPNDWRPGYGLVCFPETSSPLYKGYIIQGTAPYRIAEYRDPSVNKLIEANWGKQLRAAYRDKNWKETRGRWYPNPNTLGRPIITTLRATTGAEDEIRRKQLQKLEAMKKQGLAPQYIDDIYLRGKSRKLIAKEQKISVPTLTKRVQRHLNKPVVNEDSQWAKAISRSKCDRDGVYATANLGGHTKAYFILPLTKFVESFDNNWKLPEGDLHNVICDILKRRVKNGRMKEGDNLWPMYYDVYKQFSRFGWRMLWQSEWYRENLTEVPVLSTT